MFPVLFHIVIPAGLGKLVAIAVVVLLAIGRAIAVVRRGRAEGERITFAAALRSDATLLVVLAIAVGALWRTGVLAREIRLPLHSYGLLIASAFLAGIWLAQREARRRGDDPERIADLGFWILVAALVGSRVYFILVNWEDYFGPGRTLVQS